MDPPFHSIMYDMQPRTAVHNIYHILYLLSISPFATIPITEVVSSECTSGQAKSTVILFGLVTSAKPTQNGKARLGKLG